MPAYKLKVQKDSSSFESKKKPNPKIMKGYDKKKELLK